MFDKLNIMSIVDLFQLLGRARGVFKGFFGTEGEAKAKPESEVKSEEELPKGIFAEKFTRLDESYWQKLVSLLDARTATIVRRLEAEMKRRDDLDHGERIPSFRIGVLNMPNKVSEETVTTVRQPEAKGMRRRQQQQQQPQPEAAQETIARKIDPRFTPNDARILYLKWLAELVQTEMSGGKGIGFVQPGTTGGKSEDEAIGAVIDYLEADGFLVTGDLLQKAKEIGGEAVENLFEETLRFRLEKEVYDKIKTDHPDASTEELRTLRLQALRKREDDRKKALEGGTRKKLFRKDWFPVAAPVIVIVAMIWYGTH